MRKSVEDKFVSLMVAYLNIKMLYKFNIDFWLYFFVREKENR